MKEAGNRPPMMVPSKAIYMHKDLARNAAYYGVPIKPIEVAQELKNTNNMLEY